MLTLNWGIDILFEKLAPEIGGWIWKAIFAHCSYGDGDFMQCLSFFNIFSDNLHFYALNTGLCYNCPIIGQIVEKGTI